MIKSLQTSKDVMVVSTETAGKISLAFSRKNYWPKCFSRDMVFGGRKSILNSLHLILDRFAEHFTKAAWQLSDHKYS